MKPHTTCRSAQELAWTFAFEGVAATQALQGEFKFPPTNMPAMPTTWSDTVGEVERVFKKMADTVRKVDDKQLSSTIKFYTAPKQMGDVRRPPPPAQPGHLLSDSRGGRAGGLPRLPALPSCRRERRRSCRDHGPRGLPGDRRRPTAGGRSATARPRVQAGPRHHAQAVRR